MIAISLSVLLTFPIQAFAEDGKIPLTDKDIREVKVDGEDWVAFAPKPAQMLLELNIKFPLLERQLANMTELKLNKDKEIRILTGMNDNLKQQKVSLIDENKGLRIQLDEKNEFWYKLWRSPYLWFCVGLVVGGATTVVIVYAVK
jgi:hypothetical protein